MVDDIMLKMKKNVSQGVENLENIIDENPNFVDTSSSSTGHITQDRTSMLQFFYPELMKYEKEATKLENNVKRAKELNGHKSPQMNELVTDSEVDIKSYEKNSHLSLDVITSVGIVDNDNPLLQTNMRLIRQNYKSMKNLNKRFEKAFPDHYHNEQFDGLMTNAYARKPGHAKLEKILKSKNPEKISILMLDIDLFKKINDDYGHKAGDMVIQALDRVIHDSIREVRKNDLAYKRDQIGDFQEDFHVRYGGEEIAVFLSGVNSKEAYQKAEYIRKKIESTSIEIENREKETKYINVTTSIGVATSDKIPREELIKRADKCLYVSKGSGRNQVQPTNDLYF